MRSQHRQGTVASFCKSARLLGQRAITPSPMIPPCGPPARQLVALLQPYDAYLHAGRTELNARRNLPALVTFSLLHVLTALVYPDQEFNLIHN